jgi:hypothetical protein
MGEMYSNETVSPQNPSMIENRVSSARAGNVQLEMNQSLNMTVGPNLEDELNIDKNTLETLKDLYV